jgi:hypothetical protein
MQFLGQISLAEVESGGAGLLSVFMCQNDPGMCSDWDSASGGNRAFVFGADAVRTPAVPGDGVTVLGESCALRIEEIDAEDYVAAQEGWQQQTGGAELDVIGQLGGRPLWVQRDETPTCGGCARPMTFVVQLQEGHDAQNAANFGGGGCGYGFRCGPCGNAAFLWQG